MTGEEHYRRAEALLESCQLPGGAEDEETYPALEGGAVGEWVDSTTHALMAAQVHATLATLKAVQ